MTPTELTRKEPKKKVTHAATIPMFAAPLPNPFKLIAVAIATREIGVTISSENVTLIKIDIIRGLNSVNELIICPKLFVIICIYGKVVNPTNPLTTGINTGKIIISKEPNFPCNNKYKAHAIIITKITFIISPIPFNAIPFAFICIAPEPNIADTPIILAPAPLNLN